MERKIVIPKDINQEDIHSTTKMPFGKYQGIVIVNIEDESYLKFMLTCKIQRSVRGAIEKKLEMLKK